MGSVRWKREKDAAVTDSYIIKRQEKDMGKKEGRIKGKEFFPWSALFFCGFFAGTILPNIMWKMKWQQKTVAAMYLLSSFSGQELDGTGLLGEILKSRGSFFILCAVCGFTVFGVPLAVGTVIAAGFGIGAVLTVCILQFGLAGAAAGIALLFPQYLIYLPALFMLLDMVFKQSISMWKNQGIFPDKVAGYSWQTVWTGGIYFLGMLLEAYVNPWITEKILMTLKIF